MCAHIKIGSISNAPKLAPAEREAIFDICGLNSVMRAFFIAVLVEMNVLRADAVSHEPVVTELDPVVEKLTRIAWMAKVLHFHLFKFSCTEDEISGRYLITKGSTSLSCCLQCCINQAYMCLSNNWKSKAKGTCAIPNGSLLRDVVITLEKLINMPCAVSGLRYTSEGFCCTCGPPPPPPSTGP